MTWENRRVSTATASYKGHRYPVEIISHWLYFRFPLSFPEVEEVMPARAENSHQPPGNANER